MNELTPAISNQVAAPKIIELDSIDDEAIKKLIADGYKLLNKRKRERERQVKDAIKQMAIDAGIKVSFRESISKNRRTTKEL